MMYVTRVDIWEKAAVMEFWQAQNVLVVTTRALFEGMGDPSKIDIPKFLGTNSLVSKQYHYFSTVCHTN